jgi:hypothetical protein
MRLKISAFFFAFLSFIFALEIRASDKTKVFLDNQVLNQELNLAKAPSFYFVLSLAEKKLALKSRGIILREWQLKKVRYWGKPIPSKSLAMIKKTAPFIPQRRSIKPSAAKVQDKTKEKQDKFELEVLELADMPYVYSFYLEGNISISIRPRAAGFLSFLGGFAHSFKWYFFNPIKTLWLTLRKQSYATIDLSLESKKEAQALYWSLLEGLKGIIIV